MQRTRLSTLLNQAAFKIERFFNNPWRRISVLIVGFLAGIFAAQVLSTTGGQLAEWDVVMAAFVLLFTEGASIIVYRLSQRQLQPGDLGRWLFVEALNLFKLGVMYGMFLEAFKLGS